jgi:hypothetical protein
MEHYYQYYHLTRKNTKAYRFFIVSFPLEITRNHHDVQGPDPAAKAIRNALVDGA